MYHLLVLKHDGSEQVMVSHPASGDETSEWLKSCFKTALSVSFSRNRPLKRKEITLGNPISGSCSKKGWLQLLWCKKSTAQVLGNFDLLFFLVLNESRCARAKGGSYLVVMQQLIELSVTGWPINYRLKMTEDNSISVY